MSQLSAVSEGTALSRELSSERAAEILIEEADGPLVADLQKVRDAGQKMLRIIEGNFTSFADSPPPMPLAAEDETETAPYVDRRVIAPGLLLVVDDDETNRDVLSRRLKRQGHKVETASSGSDMA